ncbi:MAG: cupin domain-containing protein [Chloroflexaceae bacterium]|nr:cupin domain-containing protein [Chloroflexaceae bacterium]
MAEPTFTLKSGDNFATVDLGPFSQLNQYIFTLPQQSLTVDGKVFLREAIALTSAEISLNGLPPGKSMPFYHKHRLNEEIYLFISGQGEFQVDDTVFALKGGTVVRVDPPGERCLRNTSAEETLHYIVVQARAGTVVGSTIDDGFAVSKRVSWVNKARL